MKHKESGLRMKTAVIFGIKLLQRQKELTAKNKLTVRLKKRKKLQAAQHNYLLLLSNIMAEYLTYNAALGLKLNEGDRFIQQTAVYMMFYLKTDILFYIYEPKTVQTSRCPTFNLIVSLCY